MEKTLDLNVDDKILLRDDQVEYVLKIFIKKANLLLILVV